KRNNPGTTFTPFDPARGCASNYLFKIFRSEIDHKRHAKFETLRGAALATALPLQAEDGDEIYDALWLPPIPEGDGGSAWERAAEQSGLSVQVLRECADGRDLQAEARAAEREERRRAVEEAAAARLDLRRATEAAKAARAALAALSPEARAERARAHKKAYQAAYYQRKKEEAARKKGKTPSQG
ncbi:MAG TPA: hypothetical protein PKW90_15615, partial [Myxococcota bacterium]|nr:hypothetical protein [Myxococcota bacterium]